VLAEPHNAAEGYITITFVDNDMPALSRLVVVEILLKVQPLLCIYECIASTSDTREARDVPFKPVDLELLQSVLAEHFIH
jgi:hypothetical protein